MFSTLDLDLRPGNGLGIFEIGTSLWAVIESLRQRQHAFPQVEVKFDPDSSVTTPIILHLRPHIDLLFSGRYQRLHTVCLRKLRDPHPPVTLRYKEGVMSSPEEVLRRVGVSRTFGPTYQGDDLRYPGVHFSFEDDSALEGGKKSSLDDRTQEVKRVLISQKLPDGAERDALDEVVDCAAMNGQIVQALVKIHVGVTLRLHQSSKPLQIRIGETTAQDLTLDLGAPLRVYYKDDDRMGIHSASEETRTPETEYFYNYFQYGLDFLLSPNHVVKKILLHTNIPGSPLFQRYNRCPWEIAGEPEDDEDESPPSRPFYDRFEQLSRFMGHSEPPQPMVLNRTDDQDGLTLPSPTTRLYAYDGIILEVTEASHVACVTLF